MTKISRRLGVKPSPAAFDLGSKLIERHSTQE